MKSKLTSEELKHELCKKFKVLEFIDLASIADRPTTGFAVFKNQYKEVFEPNERIVFYTGQFVGAKTLAYLQYAADLFDISRCFVLVCCAETSNPVISNDIEFMITGIDSEPFDDRNMISVNSICSLPWFHAEYMGVSKICCFNSEYAQNGTIVEFFNSDKINSLRTQLLSGEYPSSCDVCWTSESKGFSSLRQWRNKTHKEEFFTEYLDQPKIRSLVVFPSTVCNFKCRSCGPEKSSQWMQEELAYAADESEKQKLFELISVTQWFNSDKSKEIFDIWPTLEYIDIYGGEPLMNKQFKELLQTSIQSGVAKKQRLHFNTNGSLFPVELIELMHEFKEVTISLSIDDIGKRFEIIRGGTWAEVDHHVDLFLSCNPEIFKISGQITVSNLNVLYLDELLSWAEDKKLPLTLQMLSSPEYLQYDRVTQTVKNLVVKKYHNHPNQTLQDIAKSIQETVPVDGRKWVAEMTRLDSRRKQNMLSSHFELASGMGYPEFLAESHLE